MTFITALQCGQNLQDPSIQNEVWRIQSQGQILLSATMKRSNTPAQHVDNEERTLLSLWQRCRSVTTVSSLKFERSRLRMLMATPCSVSERPALTSFLSLPWGLCASCSKCSPSEEGGLTLSIPQSYMPEALIDAACKILNMQSTSRPSKPLKNDFQLE